MFKMMMMIIIIKIKIIIIIKIIIKIIIIIIIIKIMNHSENRSTKRMCLSFVFVLESVASERYRGSERGFGFTTGKMEKEN
jgi:hypothetical protein